LGARRTGAIGAVAVDVAAKPGPIRLGLVGAGTQAWTQLWAIRAVRELAEVSVAARHPERAVAFADRAAAELDVVVRPVASAEDAGRDQDVVGVATCRTTPSRPEFPADLAGRAAVILTDSPAQLPASPEPHVFADQPLTDLGAVL